MAKSDNLELQGIVTSHNRDLYSVQVETPNGPIDVDCTLGGKIRMNFIKILVGDKVAIQVSTYDLSKGKITYRYK